MGIDVPKLRQNGLVLFIYAAAAFAALLIFSDKSAQSTIITTSCLVFGLSSVVMIVRAFESYFKNNSPAGNSYIILTGFTLILLFTTFLSLLLTVQC